MLAVPPAYQLLILCFLVIGCFLYVEKIAVTAKIFTITAILTVLTGFIFQGMISQCGLIYYSYFILADILVFFITGIVYLLQDTSQKRQIAFVILLLICFLTVLGMTVSADMVWSTKYHFHTCQSNLINIGTYLERYYADNGIYPESLDELKPEYCSEIPWCFFNGSHISPKASEHYKKQYGNEIRKYEYIVSTDKQNFTVYCEGRNHSNVGIKANYPQYTSKEKLLFP